MIPTYISWLREDYPLGTATRFAIEVRTYTS